MFIDCDYPLIATARLSGMMLDYRTLMKLGIGGLRSRITALQKEKGDNAFYRASLECLDLFGTCCDALKEKAQRDLTSADAARAADLCRMIDALDKIKSDAPETFYEALQLFWLQALSITDVWTMCWEPISSMTSIPACSTRTRRSVCCDRSGR